MKKFTSAALNTTNKKIIFAVICLVLVAIIGGGIAFALAGNADNKDSTIESIAQDFIKNEIRKCERKGIEITDSKISQLELVTGTGLDNLADRTIYVFSLEYRLVPKDINKAKMLLSDGMRIDENGWITEWSSKGTPLIVAFEEEGKAELIGILWTEEVTEKNGGLEAAVKALLE